jgi:hypothetical protein
LNGEPIRLGQLVKKSLGNGVQLGEWGACTGRIKSVERENIGISHDESRCHNEGRCVELYDGFKCELNSFSLILNLFLKMLKITLNCFLLGNCSLTPFAGDTCEEGFQLIQNI